MHYMAKIIQEIYAMVINMHADEIDRVSNPEVLFVLLHAFGRTPRDLNRVADLARGLYPSSDIYTPTLPLRWWSCANPESIACQIATSIDHLDSHSRDNGQRSGYREVILIGHSAGATLARSAFSLATLSRLNCSSDVHGWTTRTSRIILLAAMSRGWRISSALNPVQRLVWSLGAGIGHLVHLFSGRELFFMGLRRGSPFLTSARLQWLRIAKHIPPEELPITVQILGTDDDYVAPTDNVDLAADSSFLYLEVPHATHRNIVEFDKVQDGDAIKSCLVATLTQNRTTLKQKSIRKEDVFEVLGENVEDCNSANLILDVPKADIVLFVIHGIRDRGFWTRRIARYIREMAYKRGRLCRSVTSTYGYFPMGPFLLPWVRHGKVEWFLDQYVTARALHPDAEFAFVGHSNGTYLLARALELCSEVRFEKVIFAGSAVAEDYKWSRFTASSNRLPRQIGKVLNYVASSDWVVAIFPNGLNKLGVQTDLGAAGHYGFDEADERVSSRDTAESASFGSASNSVQNLRFVPGRHSAALGVENWHDMAAFILGDEVPHVSHAVPSQQRNTVRWGKLSGLVWLALIVVALALLVSPWIGLWFSGGLTAIGLGLWLLLMLASIRVFLTKA